MGMTNEALATAVGVGVRLVQKWRSGETRPRYENLCRVAKATGHEVAWFYSDNRETPRRAA